MGVVKNQKEIEIRGRVKCERKGLGEKIMNTK